VGAWSDCQLPKLDVAGSIPIWTAGAHPENKVGPALATLSGNIRLISTAGMGGKHSWARTNTGFALAAVAGNLSFVAMNSAGSGAACPRGN